MNPSAVRYYIEKALLSPKRENGQYSFDQSCMEQMDRIMRYKKCRFSLEEIEVLSYFEGTTNLKDEAILQEFLQMYYEKAASIKQKIKELDAILQYIQQDIEHYQKKPKRFSRRNPRMFRWKCWSCCTVLCAKSGFLWKTLTLRAKEFSKGICSATADTTL